MSDVSKFGIDLSGGKLQVFDLDEPQRRVPVDQVIFAATAVDGLVAEGHIVAIHGLPFELAESMPLSLQRYLGVAPQFTPGMPGRRGFRRLRAVAGSSKFQEVQIP